MSLLSLSKKILSKKSAAPREQLAAVAVPAKQNSPAVTSRIKWQVVMTEKSIGQQAHNTLIIRVEPQATKGQIAAAIQDKYGVPALKIRTSNYRPKNRRRGATYGRTNYWKKAYVTVSDIQSVTTGP